jgi:hypothetical protein
MIYFSFCFIIINNRLIVMKCYSSLGVSGFSRNEFNLCVLFRVLLFVYLFLFGVKIGRD